ncbi:MAG: hypothetical protein ACKVS5_07835 [Parvularculaceae bacterium]
MTKQVLAVFKEQLTADSAVTRLVASGVAQSDVSVLMGEGYKGKHFGVEGGNKAAEGVATGGVAGGVLGAIVAGIATTGAIAATGGAGLLAAGPIVAALTGAGAGAAAGGVLGGLVGLGIPEHKAKIYKDIIDNDGGFLIGVETSKDNVGNVKDILKSAGGESLSVE